MLLCSGRGMPRDWYNQVSEEGEVQLVFLLHKSTAIGLVILSTKPCHRLGLQVF